ncbi:MAG TPA: hypothetical protein VGD60_06720 [Candidatus Acidoferrales bacterium]
MRSTILAALTLFLLVVSTAPSLNAQAMMSKPAQDAILKPADITPALFPDKVFFRGKTAASQLRNAAGVKFADKMYFLAALVDNSGYSTAIREKYQAYIITEVPLEIGGSKLPAGSYGVGFLTGQKFVVMDLGAHEIFTVDTKHDDGMKHAVPLQIVAGSTPGSYLLYNGRDSVEVKRAN